MIPPRGSAELRAPAGSRGAGSVIDVRLQKLLAAAGLGSRRTIEEWIRAGRVTIAGRPAKLGDRAAPQDDVRLDGAPIRIAPEAVRGTGALLLYHKPVGEVTTRSDPQGRRTVFDHLPPLRHGRWIAIGRLDVNTSGLLLFTTDGNLAHRLMHPSTEIEREYRVRVRGTPDPAVLRRLLTGMALEDGPARFDRIVPEQRPAPQQRPALRGSPASETSSRRLLDGTDTRSSHSWYRVVLHEGRNREVRRLWAAAGFEVSRLVRVRYGTLKLPESLRPGTWRLASADEVERLASH